jgi:hypothetical protein
MTDDDRISNLFGSGELPEEIQHAPDEVRDRWEELRTSSPAVAMAEDLLNSGLPFNEDLQKKPSSYTHGLPGLNLAEPGPRYDPAHPDRPQHEDFWKMSEIVRRTDALADQTEELDFLDMTLAGVDVGSVQYMARQRVERAVSRIPFPTDQEARRAEDYAAYMDGFLLGYQLAKKNAPQIQQLLDESIDGQHRQQP